MRIALFLTIIVIYFQDVLTQNITDIFKCDDGTKTSGLKIVILLFI
jgi:hypothetical protein